MKSVTTLKTALRALRRNVMRTLLTMLGIIIGIAAVIAMMAIGDGSSKAIQSTIASMGANVLMIMPGTASSGGVSFGTGSVMTLTPQDCDAILKECTAVAGAAPVVRARTQVVYGNHNWVPMSIYGTTPQFLRVRDWTDIADGDAFSNRDVRNASKVCLIGQTLVRELFNGQSPVGKEIRVQNVAFKVVGVLSKKGANMMGMDQDDILLAPWTTIKYRVVGSSVANVNQSQNAAANTVNTLNQLYPNVQPSLYAVPTASQQADTPQNIRFTNVDQILVMGRSADQVPLALEQVTQLLRERHHIRPKNPDDFVIRDMTELTRALGQTTGLMTTLLLCVAMISLVVGGVGIMNIMLVSVTERTREIGLRMAVGAEPGDILRQFLTEAIALSSLGGIIGIMLGINAQNIVKLIVNVCAAFGIPSGILADVAKWPTLISITTIVIAFLFSAAVGIFFGFYPARKASRLDPIEALRYE